MDEAGEREGSSLFQAMLLPFIHIPAWSPITGMASRAKAQPIGVGAKQQSVQAQGSWVMTSYVVAQMEVGGDRWREEAR